MEIIQSLQPALPFIQIILAVLLIASILLQQRGSSLGGAFGAELFLFKFSIGIAVLFVVAAFMNVLI